MTHIKFEVSNSRLFQKSTKRNQKHNDVALIRFQLKFCEEEKFIIFVVVMMMTMRWPEEVDCRQFRRYSINSQISINFRTVFKHNFFFHFIIFCKEEVECKYKLKFISEVNSSLLWTWEWWSFSSLSLSLLQIAIYLFRKIWLAWRKRSNINIKNWTHGTRDFFSSIEFNIHLLWIYDDFWFLILLKDLTRTSRISSSLRSENFVLNFF